VNGAARAECIHESREIGGVRGAPEVHELNCKIPTDPNGGFRVTFLRLNEVLAGNLALKEPTPEIASYFGSDGLVSNEVAAELEALFKRFGRKQVFRADTIGLMLRNSKGGPSTYAR
jgi:hypothetical protein